MSESISNESPHPFQIGDVVRLKSGGPQMTVEAYADTDVLKEPDSPEDGYERGAACIWFVQDDVGAWSGPKFQTFPFGALAKAA